MKKNRARQYTKPSIRAKKIRLNRFISLRYHYAEDDGVMLARIVCTGKSSSAL